MCAAVQHWEGDILGVLDVQVSFWGRHGGVLPAFCSFLC